MAEKGPYDPLSRENLTRSVAEAMLEQVPAPLGSLPPFVGAGIYAIYYSGSFSAYGVLASQNKGGAFRRPIYVGKAIPQGARKGGTGAVGRDLHGRLREHADTIGCAENLRLEDFHCRYLVVEDIWIPLGESVLIARFSPLWNLLVDGFGNHNPGKGRFNGMRSKWDVLHPGRPWAPSFQPRQETAEQIASEVEEYLRAMPEPSPHMLGPDTGK